MKDIDFDELDSAISGAMAQTPSRTSVATPPPQVSRPAQPERIAVTINRPAARPTPLPPIQASVRPGGTVVDTPPTPVRPAIDSPVQQPTPQSTQAVGIKRPGGKFMDFAMPSKSPALTRKPVSRDGGIVQPSVAPQPPVEEPVADTAAGDTPVDQSDLAVAVSVRQQPAVSEEAPDKPTTDPDTVESATQSDNTEETPQAVAPVFTPLSDTPFIVPTDAAIEKRPLGSPDVPVTVETPPAEAISPTPSPSDNTAAPRETVPPTGATFVPPPSTATDDEVPASRLFDPDEYQNSSLGSGVAHSQHHKLSFMWVIIAGVVLLAAAVIFGYWFSASI